jgi:hypothetical protein
MNTPDMFKDIPEEQRKKPEGLCVGSWVSLPGDMPCLLREVVAFTKGGKHAYVTASGGDKNNIVKVPLELITLFRR